MLVAYLFNETFIPLGTSEEMHEKQSKKDPGGSEKGKEPITDTGHGVSSPEFFQETGVWQPMGGRSEAQKAQESWKTFQNSILQVQE